MEKNNARDVRMPDLSTSFPFWLITYLGPTYIFQWKKQNDLHWGLTSLSHMTQTIKKFKQYYPKAKSLLPWQQRCVMLLNYTMIDTVYIHFMCYVKISGIQILSSLTCNKIWFIIVHIGCECKFVLKVCSIIYF